MTKQVYVVVAIHSHDSHQLLKAFLSEEKAMKYLEELNNDNRINRAMIGYLDKRLADLNAFLHRAANMSCLTPDDVCEFVKAFNNKTIYNLDKMEGKEEDKQIFIQGYLDRSIVYRDDTAYFYEVVELVE